MRAPPQVTNLCGSPFSLFSRRGRQSPSALLHVDDCSVLVENKGFDFALQNFWAFHASCFSWKSLEVTDCGVSIIEERTAQRCYVPLRAAG